MNANTIGKTLVFLNLVVSLIAMTWGAGIFLQQVDWGWKEPRKELGERVPSEVDKRAAALNQAYHAFLTVKPRLQPAQDKLQQAQAAIGPNHLLYVKKLDELRNGLDPIKVKALIYQKGILKLQSQPLLDPDRLTAPEFGVDELGVVKGSLPPDFKPITKSMEGYYEELKKIQGEVKEVNARAMKLHERDQALTRKLMGQEDKELGRIPGLYDLQEIEKKLQDVRKLEMEYIRPIWVLTLEESNRYMERQAEMKADLAKPVRKKN